MGSTVNRQRGVVRRAPASGVVGTTYSTAPAAVGAISRGVTPRIQHTADGVVVFGEDFIATASSLSSSITTWATVAGFPISPYSMGTNTLADISRTYAEWRIREMVVCYVPAVGTSANGQIALYRKTRRADPHSDPTGANFFSFVLNQNTGVIGPVWQPVSFAIKGTKDWLSTVPLEAVDINEECDGEIFLATNNNVSSGSSPPIGILKIMYAMEFRRFQRNPRQSLIPLLNQIYFNTSLGGTSLAIVSGNTANFNIVGNDQTGNPATQPTSVAQGDIFKFVIDTTRTTFGTTSTVTLLAETLVGGNRVVSIENGFTMYVLFAGSSYSAYPTVQQALATSTPYVWGTTTTTSFNLVGMLSLVGNVLARTQNDL